jgi:hypothetical protein
MIAIKGIFYGFYFEAFPFKPLAPFSGFSIFLLGGL